MANDININESAILETLNAKIDHDGGNFPGSGLEKVFNARASRLAMFDTVLKDHELSFEESKGLALQGTWVYCDAIAGERYGYPDFYNKCLEERTEARDTGGAQHVTLGGSSVAMYIHPNGHMYYDISIKDTMDTWFNKFGHAWFYGVDMENKRIFLPRNNWFEQATDTTVNVGLGTEAGLPDITGSFALGDSSDPYTTYTNHLQYGSGAFYSDTTAQYGYNEGGGAATSNIPKFAASRSNAIYGKSTTVQPIAVKKLLYICVGNTESDLAWVDVVTQVNGGVKDINDAYQSAMNKLQAVGPVLKTGSTMTGSLISEQSSYYQFVAKSTIIDATVTPTATQYVGIDFKDQNDVRLGWFGVGHDKSGLTCFNLMNFKDVSDGFIFPKCTAKATTTSSAGNHKVAVIVQNYRNGGSWYRVWSDGWIEQGGRFDFKYATQTITFVKAFTTTDYCFVAATDSKEFVFEKNQVTCLSAWGTGYAYGVQSWYACGY